jgi:polysaccharide deacetylase 2 family uncharacterized protein YibQ
MKSFRPLLIFWLCTLCLLGAGAAILQFLGPAGSAAISPPRPVAAKTAPLRQPQPVPEPASAIPAPDASLLEPAVEWPGRMLPRIADSGRTSAQEFAGAFDPAEKHPRIALLIDGIGLDKALSQQVLRSLPRAIDIAYSAYAPEAVLDALEIEARHQGRECLVSIPMEPSGYPAVEEGEKSLMTGNLPAQNRNNLDWVLSNVQGCVGATGGSDGMQGERYAESRQSFADLLSNFDHRGLLYLDPRPGAPAPGMPGAGRALPRDVDVVIDPAVSADEPATAEVIDRNLATLERLAAEHGSAIGLAGPPHPVLLERLAVWANGLAARHLVLAPLTALPPPRPPSQDAAP